MKEIIYFILLLVITNNKLNSQSCYISYSYDNSGNRISRVYVGSCAKTIKEEIPEISLIGIDSTYDISLVNDELYHTQTVRVFPNPVNNDLYIEVRNVEDAIHYVIWDMQGREFQTNKINETVTTLDVSLIPSGVYLIAIFNIENKIVYKTKIIIQ